MSSENFLIDEQDNVCTITINRAEKRNAFTNAMWPELTNIMRGLGERGDLRVVIIRGAGDKAFCAGIDLTELGEEGMSDHDAWDDTGLEDTMRSLTEFPYPVIAMVNGHAIAGGCELALHCDLIIAADTVHMGMPVAKIGLMVPFPLTQRLVNAIGLTNARDLLFTGRLVAADEARAMGMVNEVVPSAELEGRVRRLATDIAHNAPLSLIGLKRALARCQAYERDIDYTDVHEHMIHCFNSADHAEGLAAFRERRAPQFTGK